MIQVLKMVKVDRKELKNICSRVIREQIMDSNKINKDLYKKKDVETLKKELSQQNMQ